MRSHLRGTLYKRFGLTEAPDNAEGATAQSLLKVLFSGVVAAITGAVLARMLGMVANVLITRQLGVALYGEYATLMANLGLLASLLGLGLDTWLLQEGGRRPERLSHNVWQILALKAIGGAIMLVLLAAAGASRAVFGLAFVVGVAGIILDSFVQTGYTVLRATRRNGRIALFQIVSPLLLIATLWLAGAAGPSVVLLLVVQVACSVAVIMTLMLHIRHTLGGERPRLDLLPVIKGAWLFVAADVCSNIYTQSGAALLGAYVSSTAVGIYRPTLTLISSTFLIPNLIFAVGLPILSARDTTEKNRRNLIYAMSIGSVLYGLVLMATLWLGGQTFLHILYGPEWDAALPLIRIMSGIPLVKAGSFICVAVLIAYNQQKIRIILQSIVVALSVVGGLFIIPRYGITGAAWLYVGVEVTLFILYFCGARYAMRRSRS